MVVTFATFQSERSKLNFVESKNIFSIFVTLAVFHAAIFPLNVVAPEKRNAILVTVEVSQVEISPYVVVAVVGSLSHEATATPMLPVVITVLSARSFSPDTKSDRP